MATHERQRQAEEKYSKLNETKKTRQLNAIHDPRLNPGPENNYFKIKTIIGTIGRI